MFGHQYLYFLKHNLEARLLKRRRPLLAGFKITNRCNLRCRVCPFWKMADDNVPYTLALGVMDKLYAGGVRLLILEGGEPLIWKDEDKVFEDLVREAKTRFFCTGVTTNGLLPLETSADTVWVSVDGLRDTHNYNRGNSFDRVMANIESSSHPKILANITINRVNCKEIPELIEFLDGRVKGITIQFYYPYEGTQDLWVERPERVWVLDELMRLKGEGYAILDSYITLEALKENTWRCHSWLIANAEPDGSINYGCYLKNRADISCAKCGFAAHTEISKAYDWNLQAIRAGSKIFGFR
ncbi:MAG: radical SAM protein [Gemmatimonadota bacterium]|nr:MAG: radical SAM protein [Gemmatimonadota bacterium]